MPSMIAIDWCLGSTAFVESVVTRKLSTVEIVRPSMPMLMSIIDAMNSF